MRLLIMVGAYGAFVDRPFAHVNRAVADGRIPRLGCQRPERRCCSLGASTVAYTKSFAPGARHESIRAESVSHHVAGDVGRGELRTQTGERRPVIVRDGNDVALCHAHAG